MRFLVAADRHERFGVAHGHGHVPREQVFRVSQARQRLVLVTRLHLRLPQGCVQHGEALMLLHELAENLFPFFRLAARRQRERVAVLDTQRVLSVVHASQELFGDVGVRFSRHHAQTLADEIVALGFLRLLRNAELRRTGARLCDAIGEHRVIHEHRRDVRRRKANTTRSRLEEIRQRVRVVAGRHEVADAHPVRLFLVVAREVDLLLSRDALCGGHAAFYGLSAATAADGAKNDCGQDRRCRGDGLLTLRFDCADRVMLGDVRDFVRHDARQLRLVTACQHEAIVDEYESARQRERIDHGILHCEELKAAAAVGTLGRELRADAVQVLVDFRIFDERVLIA